MKLEQMRQEGRVRPNGIVRENRPERPRPEGVRRHRSGSTDCSHRCWSFRPPTDGTKSLTATAVSLAAVVIRAGNDPGDCNGSAPLGHGNQAHPAHDLACNARTSSRLRGSSLPAPTSSVPRPAWTSRNSAEKLGLSEGFGHAKLTVAIEALPLGGRPRSGAGDQPSTSDCYLASRAPASLQAELLAKKLAGATGEQMATTARKATAKPRNHPCDQNPQDEHAATRAGTVVVSVEGEMDMEGLIETLGTALEAAKKANKESLDIKTAEKGVGRQGSQGLRPIAHLHRPLPEGDDREAARGF